LCRVYWELRDHLGNFVTIISPGARVKGKGSIAGVGVADGVPDGVEGCDSGVVYVGEALVVATGVAVFVGVVDEGGGVEGLVDVAYVVDNESECERLLVLFSREVSYNTLIVD